MKLYSLLTGPVLVALSFTSAAEEPKNPKPAEPVQLNVYDVSDVIAPIRDYPGPAYATSQTFHRASTGNPFAQAHEPAGIQAADIAALISERLLPKEFADPATAIQESNGRLVVMQTARVQTLIGEVIKSLRETTRPQVCVKAVLAALPDTPEETYFDDAAFTKLTAAGDAVLASPRLVCYSGQRAHVVSGREINAVTDLDISGNAYDPVVSTLLDGFVLDVRPQLAADRSATELTLSFSWNANVTRQSAAIGLQRPAAASATVALPPQKSAESSGQKFATEKKKEEKEERQPIEEHKSTSVQEAGTLLNTQYISRIDLDSVTMDSTSTRAQVGVPAGKWVLAATFDNPDPKAAQKQLQLFVSVEALGK
jgi:hypothetical protein